MKYVLLVILALLCCPAFGAGNCRPVTDALYGFSLGPVHNYPQGLRRGIVREGTAQFIADAGLESLEGEADGVVYPRIMVLYDRGRFVGSIAVGRIKSEKDAGFGKLVSAVAKTVGAEPSIAKGRVTFACEDQVELTIEPTAWDDGQDHVKVTVMDRAAHKAMLDHMTEYCADPAKRRPQDACKRN